MYSKGSVTEREKERTRDLASTDSSLVWLKQVEPNQSEARKLLLDLPHGCNEPSSTASPGVLMRT